MVAGEERWEEALEAGRWWCGTLGVHLASKTLAQL